MSGFCLVKLLSLLKIEVTILFIVLIINIKLFFIIITVERIPLTKLIAISILTNTHLGLTRCTELTKFASICWINDIFFLNSILNYCLIKKAAILLLFLKLSRIGYFIILCWIDWFSVQIICADALLKIITVSLLIFENIVGLWIFKWKKLFYGWSYCQIHRSLPISIYI